MPCAGSTTRARSSKSRYWTIRPTGSAEMAELVRTYAARAVESRASTTSSRRIQGRRPGRRVEGRRGRRSSSSTRTLFQRQSSSSQTVHYFSDPKVGMVQARVGPFQLRRLPAHRVPGHVSRRAFRRGAGQPEPQPLFSTSTARPASGAARRSRRRRLAARHADRGSRPQRPQPLRGWDSVPSRITWRRPSCRSR